MATEQDIKAVAAQLRGALANSVRKKLHETIKRGSKLKTSGKVQAVVAIHRDTLPQYHTPANVEAALEAIDLGKIYGAVEEHEKRQDESKGSKHRDSLGKSYAYTDFLVMELLRWFKEDFFQWVNTPACPRCQKDEKVRGVGRTPASREEQVDGGASTTEIYLCERCREQFRFPRYNKLTKLLQWRRGRCGEWNNCFMLLLSAMGVRSRYVWNAEDHVWCEYFSEALGRWVHLDSCENAMDKPHLYSEGWGKKMSYCIAIGDDYVIDVSDKYIVKNALPKDIPNLGGWIQAWNALQWAKLSDTDLLKVIRQYRDETAIPVTVTTNAEVQPRESGRGQWTDSRGESGA